MIIKALTDTGMRSENQDSFWAGQMNYEGGEAALVGVFDGMGGLFGGAQASSAVAQTIDALVADGVGVLSDSAIISNLEAVNNSIYHYAQANNVTSGTTCTLLALTNEGYRLHQVGDSRCYRVRRYGSVIRISDEHTAFAKYVAEGSLVQSNGQIFLKGKPVTPEQVNKFRGTLTRAIGVKQSPGIVTKAGTYNKGDAFLLASDGFWHYLESVKEWGKSLHKALDAEAHSPGSTEAYLNSLVDHFKKLGESDNLTAVVVKA